MLKICLIICTSLSFGVLPGESLQNEAKVVYPELFNARDDSGTKTLKINDEVTLQLKKSSVLHDEFFLETQRDGVPLVQYPDVEKFEEDLYHDETRLASVFVTEENGFVKVEGVVGPNLKIRPLEGTERANQGFFPHALELISKEPENIRTVHGEHIQARNDQGRRRVIKVDRAKAKAVHPEIRLVVDKAFSAGFKSLISMARYLMIEVNSIRIRYLTVGDPPIHLKFRAIEVLADDIECDYYVYLSETKVDGIATIYSLVKYVERYKHKYQRYDIVMVLTGYDMVRVNDKGEWETDYRGFAFVASVCKAERVGFSEDYAYTYAGIRTIAHELAHTLGCAHDQSEEGTYLPGYYANSTACPWSDGYIMSYIVKNSNSLKFSSCCDRSMSIVAKSTKIDCLYEISTGTRLKKHKSKTLPGHFLSRDQQCKLSYLANPETYHNTKNRTIGCVTQCAVWWQKGLYFWNQVLLDGTKCGRKKPHPMVCINGECVKKQPNYPIKRVPE